ncbi:MAG: glycine/D-amino acid oxidase-like deaminating enzyme [Paracoccaceae bacterium]|jgi:glycine/D-amino acid oxidase-like deaminating enzyme
MKFDAIIVGGGIVGLTHAYFLAKRGLKTCVVERHLIALGTTANNFSWVNASTKTANADYHGLNALGVQMYAELADEFGAKEIGLNPAGAIEIFAGSALAIYKAAQSTAARLDALGYENRWLEVDELRQLERNVIFADDAAGLLTPTDKFLNAPGFARLMAQKLVALGGEVHENCVALELLADDTGKVTGLRTDQGEFFAPNVILTTGPNTPDVLAEITGFDGFNHFPVNKVPGLLVTTPPVAKDLVRHLVYTDLGGEFHFFPDFNGGLRIASDDVDGQIIADQSPEHLRELARGLLRRMQGYVPDFAGETCLDDCTISIGVRAYPEDGMSIAGALPGADGLFVIATHSGVTLAPALGSLMAELIDTDSVPKMLKPFGLERLSGFGG